MQIIVIFTLFFMLAAVIAAVMMRLEGCFSERKCAKAFRVIRQIMGMTMAGLGGVFFLGFAVVEMVEIISSRDFSEIVPILLLLVVFAAMTFVGIKCITGEKKSVGMAVAGWGGFYSLLSAGGMVTTIYNRDLSGIALTFLLLAVFVAITFLGIKCITDGKKVKAAETSTQQKTGGIRLDGSLLDRQSKKTDEINPAGNGKWRCPRCETIIANHLGVCPVCNYSRQ